MKDRVGLIVLMMMVCIFFVLSGCSKQGEKKATETGGVPVKSKESSNPVVAKVANKEVRAEEVKKYLSKTPIRRIGKISERAAKGRLKEMLTSEALYQEALRLGIDEDPDVKHKIRQIIIQKLFEKKVNKPVEEWQISEKELQDYYEAHKNQFYRPEQVRIADIFIALPKDATPEQRAERRRVAEEVLQKALGAGGDKLGFSQLVRQYSDVPQRYRRGDTGYFDKEGNPVGLEKPLIEAAFELKEKGQIADRVIETSDGFHVIMLVGRRSEIKKELKDLAPALKRRMKREELAKRREALIEEVKKKSNITIDDAAFAQLIREMNEAEKDVVGQRGGFSRAQRRTRPPALPR